MMPVAQPARYIIYQNPQMMSVARPAGYIILLKLQNNVLPFICYPLNKATLSSLVHHFNRPIHFVKASTTFDKFRGVTVTSQNWKPLLE
jgi:hypothetical protein